LDVFVGFILDFDWDRPVSLDHFLFQLGTYHSSRQLLQQSVQLCLCRDLFHEFSDIFLVVPEKFFDFVVVHVDSLSASDELDFIFIFRSIQGRDDKSLLLFQMFV
jgi:hypothetical protein